MRFNFLKTSLKTAILATTVLLLGASLAVAQSVTLTAAPANLITPDGATVPMWGYTCTAVAAPATCVSLNPAAPAGTWSPVVITVPVGTLTISLANGLPAGVPTSLTIVGQLGGGLGTPTKVASPVHPVQTLTWPASGADATNTPPHQEDRVQSFGTQVAPGATTALPPWAALRPGTYLLESGTHPSIQGPMGLYGILVVTDAVGKIAYPAAGTTPAVTYGGDIPMLLSEIDPVQNAAVANAVTLAGFDENAVWSGQPGGCGNPLTANSGNCYPPAVNYSPLYYMVNGVAFSKSNSAASLFPVTTTGNVLVRIVNAGLRMHVPSIVGSMTTPLVVTTGTTAVAQPGFSLVAEDGNVLPGVSRVQSEVFLAAGKTYDVMIDVPTGTTALPFYDRELSLSGNKTARDAGMLAYIGVNGSTLPAGATGFTATANPDTYNALIAGQTLTVSDPSKGLLANDVNVLGARTLAPVLGLTLNADGTFSYLGGATSFTYCGNGALSGPACATVTLAGATIEAAGGITVSNKAFTSNTATYLKIESPGILLGDKDGAGYRLTAASVTPSGGGWTLSVDPSGAFSATVPAPGNYTFTYKAQNSQGTQSAATATVTLTFPAGNGPAITLLDGIDKATTVTDYRWIIEEDRTFFIDPACQANPLPATCPLATPQGTPAIFGTNFHTSYMPVVAMGCTGTLSCEAGQSLLGVPAACDGANGTCRTTAAQKTAVDPSQVVLDPTKRYYISVLPGDAMDPGHAMGGAQIAAACTPVPPLTACTGTFAPVTVIVEPESQPPAKVSVFVFEDDHPMNGEHDASGGIDTLSPNEPGLGGFNITILDLVGGSGDSAGQMTYDEFNQPLSNSLAGTPDPSNGGIDACPIVKDPYTGFDGTLRNTDPVEAGITGVIPVCPQYEADGTTLSPLAGQAVVNGMSPGRYGIVATPAADRIARGEEWLQTNTLDGGKDHEAFIKVNEPAYFQEFGPAGYHVSIGFANPKFINDQGNVLCAGLTGAAACTHTVTGVITGARMSRTPDQRLYSSGNRDTFGYTQCYVSLGSPDGADIRFAKCQDDGSFTLPNIPAGDWKITVFDQWNDQIVDGITTPVRVAGGDVNMGEIGSHGWKNNLYTRTCFDLGNGTAGSPSDGVCQPDEPGLTLVATNIRYRDGSISNLNSTDLGGNAGFNEVFPIFNWYVMETDSTRYKNTGTHVINDAGGPVDASTGLSGCGQAGYPSCGTSSSATAMGNMTRTAEDFSVPALLRVPGAVYCDNADCSGFSIANGPGSSSNSATLSTARIDPPWATSYGWQSFMGQNQLIEFGKKPFAAGENGGIRGHVVYASTRPFDDPALLLQLTWEPQVPNVQINLYQEGFAADNVTPTLTLVDHTVTSSWDAFAQGFRTDHVPNMNCPGQSTTDPFYYTIMNQPNLLDFYQSQHAGGTAVTPLPNNSQYKCFDGMHNWNQLQPAPYDGMYSFPSVLSRNPTTGNTAGTNCTICVKNTDPTDAFRFGKEDMLPAGKYVVEMITPPGYELVKEEDKNILLGDTYEAPVTSQFAGFGNIFIMPDQASVAGSYNANNPLIPNTNEGAQPRHEGDTGSIEVFWPCVGESRIVPDFMSLFPGSGQNAPFAGATRNLCDRKEVTLEDQMSVLAKFYVFSSTHVASHYTGIISDDFAGEFDPFAPAFGEKFSPPNLPVAVKDWAGNEIARVISDNHGEYNGLTYSTFAVNPPDPSGYIPNMLSMCMNDRGTGTDPDPFYQANYSQFCYTWSFMPGETAYLDTPVIPTSAFAAEYNHPDCAYPDTTPAIASVTGSDGVAGPWVSAAGATHIFTVTSLGIKPVSNYGYSGPSATDSVNGFNAKTVNRNFGFGDTKGTVSIGGITVPTGTVSWSNTTISFPAPTGVPACSIQQQAQYGGSNAQCGELVITAANGKKSVDTVTLTIGGKTPTVMAAGSKIQAAIDAAKPGDLIIVPPGTYHELLIMWKPVRLQGVGAASVVLDANTHPSGLLLNPWRERIVCLFGLGLDGRHESWTPGCSSSWGTTFGFRATNSNPQIDRLPLEATVGWDASLNGNLAEQLQEPSLMGAYEGAGITVLAKGVLFPNNNSEFAADTFPTPTSLLTNATGSNAGRGCNNTGTNPFTSNFQCNPSRIDGLSITNSSQGGGGIFVHAWAHNLEIANNRIYNNQGTLAGGIAIGQGEHPDGYVQGGAVANPDPGSCQTSSTTNLQLPYCFDRFVNVHHNWISQNSSEGDELFSATPTGAGGVAFCSGADNYQFNYNWVCGNLSTGDGAGVSHVGFIWDGDIEHNTIIFNQGTNPTTPSNGGGILVMSAPDTDPTCPGEPDADCSHAYGAVGDGIGRNLKINANLILGNAAEAGAGGGVRFQGVNGQDVATFPANPSRWYTVSFTNNIVANNVAGWDGGGVSLQDSIGVNMINNTIINNDATASSGTLFGAFYAPQAGSPTPCPKDAQGGNIPCYPLTSRQPAGVSGAAHSSEFLTALAPITTVNCPTGHGNGGTGTGGLTNGACRRASYPILYNDVIWQNRAFNVVVTNPAAGALQSTVALVPSFNQTFTGQCFSSPSTYWELGLRGDTSPTTHESGVTYDPKGSILSSTTGYPGGGAGFKANSASDPTVVAQYCNGSKRPPEAVCKDNNTGAVIPCGYSVPPGTNETNVPNPIFSLTAGATVDEGNNWVNISWGPLAQTVPWRTAANGGTQLADYGLSAASVAAIDQITTANSNTTYTAAPPDDFFGTARKTAANPAVDIGAVEFTGSATSAAVASVTGGPLTFPTTAVGSTSATQNLTLHNTGTATLTAINVAPSAQFVRVNTGTFPAAAPNCGVTLAAATDCTVKVAFAPTAAGAATGTATFTASVTVTGSPVALSGNAFSPGALTFALASPIPTGVTFGPVLGVPSVQFGVRAALSSTVAHVSVTNTGGAPVVFTSVTFNQLVGTNFTQTNNCPIGGTGLAVAAFCTVDITFNAPAGLPPILPRAAVATFTDNGLNSPQFLGATGR